MGNFQLGPKRLVVNNPDQAKLLFYAVLAGGKKNLVEVGDDFQDLAAYDTLLTSPDTQEAEGTTFNPADVGDNESVAKADLLRILGFGDFSVNDPIDGNKVVSVVGAKGVAPQKQVSTITIAGAGIADSVGKDINIILKYEVDTLESEFASYLSDYKENERIPISILPGDTATTIAKRFVDTVAASEDSGWRTLFTASNAAGVITITSKRPTIAIKVEAEGEPIVAGDITVVHAVTTAAFSGRNSYQQMQEIRLQTKATVRPYGEDFVGDQLPVKGALYSSYVITKEVFRPDLQGSTVSGGSGVKGEYKFELFINQTTCSDYITQLTKWLNANVPSRTMYTATTANAVLAGETPTVATTTDDTAPYTTPLV